jgi:hypothetical protein
VVFETLVHSLFNHLTQLLALESFAELEGAYKYTQGHSVTLKSISCERVRALTFVVYLMAILASQTAHGVEWRYEY